MKAMARAHLILFSFATGTMDPSGSSSCDAVRDSGTRSRPQLLSSASARAEMAAWICAFIGVEPWPFCSRTGSLFNSSDGPREPMGLGAAEVKQDDVEKGILLPMSETTSSIMPIPPACQQHQWSLTVAREEVQVEAEEVESLYSACSDTCKGQHSQQQAIYQAT